jgi:hypothetical protein
MGAMSTSTLLRERIKCEYGSVSRHRVSPHTVMDVTQHPRHLPPSEQNPLRISKLLSPTAAGPPLQRPASRLHIFATLHAFPALLHLDLLPVDV